MPLIPLHRFQQGGFRLISPKKRYRNSGGSIPLEGCRDLIEHFKGSKGNPFDETGKSIIRMVFKHLIKIQDCLFIFLQTCISNSFVVQSICIIRI